MEQLVVLVRERLWENKKWSDYFIVTNSNEPEKNLRKAIKDFLFTEEGTNVIKQTNEDFNWGDAIMYVPEEIWNKHGIKSIYEGDVVVITNSTILTVDQDEVLIPEEYYVTDYKHEDG